MSVKIPVKTPGVIAAGFGPTTEISNPYGAQREETPRHGQNGWVLAKYEWRDDGTARFLYVRDNGDDNIERKSVTRVQKDWL